MVLKFAEFDLPKKELESYSLSVLEELRGKRNKVTSDIPKSKEAMFITDPFIWANYSDELLYELDRYVRYYIKAVMFNKRKYNKKRNKVAAQIVFFWLFQRDATPEDSQTFRRIHSILSKYGTRVNGGTICGIQYKCIYRFKSSQWTPYTMPFSERLKEEYIEGYYDGWRLETLSEEVAEKRRARRKQILESAKMATEARMKKRLEEAANRMTEHEYIPGQRGRRKNG